ncbi:Serine protease inhibitor Kazal-type 5 [Manis javanica]|nr:Serine protease inhibitor Kazal-type 5 [Manis javanica]
MCAYLDEKHLKITSWGRDGQRKSNRTSGDSFVPSFQKLHGLEAVTPQEQYLMNTTKTQYYFPQKGRFPLGLFQCLSRLPPLSVFAWLVASPARGHRRLGGSERKAGRPGGRPELGARGHGTPLPRGGRATAVNRCHEREEAQRARPTLGQAGAFLPGTLLPEVQVMTAKKQASIFKNSKQLKRLSPHSLSRSVAWPVLKYTSRAIMTNSGKDICDEFRSQMKNGRLICTRESDSVHGPDCRTYGRKEKQPKEKRKTRRTWEAQERRAMKSRISAMNSGTW